MKETTKELMEEVIVRNLEQLKGMDDISEKLSLMKETKDLISAQKEVEEAEAKVVDASERRRLEELKTKETLIIEKNKQRFSWKHFAADIGKGLIFFGLAFFANDYTQTRNLGFEEHGHFTTQTARSWKPIDFMKWVR